MSLSLTVSEWEKKSAETRLKIWGKENMLPVYFWSFSFSFFVSLSRSVFFWLFHFHSFPVLSIFLPLYLTAHVVHFLKHQVLDNCNILYVLCVIPLITPGLHLCLSPFLKQLDFRIYLSLLAQYTHRFWADSQNEPTADSVWFIEGVHV